MRTTQELDRIIGCNLRRLRKAKGFTQSKLAEALDITYQQIQKFESAQNGVSAAQLAMLCVVLNCAMEVFFQRDLEDTTEQGP